MPITTAVFPTTVGDDVTIGHLAHLEGCIVEDKALIGSGSIVLHDAHVGREAVVGGGALVTTTRWSPRLPWPWGSRRPSRRTPCSRATSTWESSPTSSVPSDTAAAYVVWTDAHHGAPMAGIAQPAPHWSHGVSPPTSQHQAVREPSTSATGLGRGGSGGARSGCGARRSVRGAELQRGGAWHEHVSRIDPWRRLVGDRHVRAGRGRVRDRRPRLPTRRAESGAATYADGHLGRIAFLTARVSPDRSLTCSASRTWPRHVSWAYSDGAYSNADDTRVGGGAANAATIVGSDARPSRGGAPGAGHQRLGHRPRHAQGPMAKRFGSCSIRQWTALAEG